MDYTLDELCKRQKREFERLRVCPYHQTRQMAPAFPNILNTSIIYFARFRCPVCGHIYEEHRGI